MGDVNDFGVAVAQGDLPDGSTHNLAVPLFGRHAGEWIDLGTLGGTESGWDEGLVTISDTGLIVGHSASTDQNRPHAIAWTAMSGIVDLGTLADVGYPTYNSSYAAGVNKWGTLIVGWSGVEQRCLGCAPTLPVIWTPTFAWKNGQLITKWKIHKLDTAGLSVITHWFAWTANDFGQIVGEGSGDNGEFVGVVWTPLQNGKWKLTQLPAVADYPNSEPFNINDLGQISGDIEPADGSVWLPAFWKPLDSSRKTYSSPIVLPMPEGGFANCYTDGINELGDLTGECWAQDYSVDQAVRWTTKDTTFSQVLGFPGDWSWSFRVNNDRIAVVTYGGGDKCSADDYISCAGATQLH
jgi:probable HAF family extracellular repeat protein